MRTTVSTVVHVGAAFPWMWSLRRQAWRRRLHLRFCVARLLRATFSGPWKQEERGMLESREEDKAVVARGHRDRIEVA